MPRSIDPVSALIADGERLRADLIGVLRAEEARIAAALTALGEAPTNGAKRRGRPPGSRNGAGRKKAGAR